MKISIRTIIFPTKFSQKSLVHRFRPGKQGEEICARISVAVLDPVRAFTKLRSWRFQFGRFSADPLLRCIHGNQPRQLVTTFLMPVGVINIIIYITLAVGRLPRRDDGTLGLLPMEAQMACFLIWLHRLG